MVSPYVMNVNQQCHPPNKKIKPLTNVCWDAIDRHKAAAHYSSR